MFLLIAERLQTLAAVMDASQKQQCLKENPGSRNPAVINDAQLIILPHMELQ